MTSYTTLVIRKSPSLRFYLASLELGCRLASVLLHCEKGFRRMYLQNHPERLREYGGVLAVEAYMEAFPCK